MALASETTPLLKDNYDLTFKPYKRKTKGLCTCLSVGIGILIFIAFVGAVWYIFESKSKTSSPQNEEGSNDLLQNKWPLPDDRFFILPYQSLITLINEAVDEGKQQLKVRQLKDENIPPLDSNSPTYKHQQSIVFSPRGTNLSNYGYIEAEATKYLRDKGVHNHVINYDSAIDLKWANETNCLRNNQSTLCEATPYRSINGSCNNLKNQKKWGVAMTPFRRALRPEYEDEVSAPRGGFESTLPSARDISTQIHRPVYLADENFSVMLAVWGQFLDHDITATALSRGVNATPITCCNSKIQHPECFPVILKSNDPYYSKFNLTCMEFVRSAPALRCSFGPREQLNQASSYIDGSMIYGNTESLAYRLRTFNNGELEMLYTEDGRALLPVSTDPSDGCNQVEQIKKGRYCFISGDTRANENTHLVSAHLLLARQHNNIANQLRDFNPFWDDETLYQESRRIVIAQLQHITYNEFLPSILGDQLMEKLELSSYKKGYWTKYNDDVDATISNNFASATFRFAHTLIPRMMKLLANDTESPEYIEMHKMLFNPFGLYDGELDSIIRGALNTSAEKADKFFTEQLTKHLFETTGEKKSSSKSFGLDLVSLNIQRGRDHGLPPYVRFRNYCNLSKVETYDDLKGIFDEESLASVSSLYKSVYDIDLYTGGLSEIPISGGLLGPTLTCLIADQFYRLKHGDRFWYETNEKPQAFTPEQLDEIRKTSLAGIICENADDLREVTPSVMRSAKENNEHVPCFQIPQPNISVWQENPEKHFGLNVTHIRIEYPERVYTWSNGSDTQLPPEFLSNAQLTSVVTWKINTHQHNVVELRGTFTFFTKSGKELNGVFELKAETSGYLNINNIRIKFPIYISDNSTNSNISKSSQIIFHTVPISTGKLVWRGSVSVKLIPLFWSNDTNLRSNKTEENKSQERVHPQNIESSVLKTTHNRGQEEYPESGSLGFEGSKLPVPSKRGQTADSETNNLHIKEQETGEASIKLTPQPVELKKGTTESNLKKDYDFFKNNGTANKEVETDEDEIYITVPDFASINNSAHEDNILYHILENQTPKPSDDSTLEEDELEFLRELSPNASDIYLNNNSPKPRPEKEQVIPVRISAKQMEISDHPILNPPANIPTNSIENQTVIWNFNSTDHLDGFFETHNKNKTFKLKYDSSTKNDFNFDPNCKYYSKISLHEPTNESNLFDLDLKEIPDIDGCTIIAPLQLHGNKTSPETFEWDGNITILTRKLSKNLNREEELSLHLKKPKDVFNLQKVDGTISINERPLWNGSLPVVFHTNNLGWLSTKHAIAYPVSWSGDYEGDSDFIGKFIVLERTNTSVEKIEGQFSIKVPQFSSIREIIKPFEIYQSVVFLTEKPSSIQEIDIYQFDEIEEWDSDIVSKIILTGKFNEDGFVWLGNITYIVPEDMETTSESNDIFTYRPRGKYLAKIFDATLFAVLDNSSKVLKWWSGVLPSTVIIPASLPHLETYKRIFNKAILWTYEEQNTFPHAIFKTYGNESNIYLFGDFQFQITSLFENIKTSSLKPNVTYYSPLVLQGEKKYTIETDLISKLDNMRDSKAGVFAPIMLLGDFIENNKFEWNLETIVHVEEE